MMMLDLLLATIAATTPAARVVPTTPPAPPARLRAICRSEFGMASLVQRVRVCHGAAEWRAIDARRRARRRTGA